MLDKIALGLVGVLGLVWLALVARGWGEED